MQLLFIVFLCFASSLAIAPLVLSTQNPVNNSYIVVFKTNVASDIIEDHKLTLLKMDPSHTITADWRNVLKGFAGTFTKTGLNYVLQSEHVDYVEQDQIMSIDDLCISQTPSTWGLARISTRGPPIISDTYRYDRLGAGVKAFILDTGILITHNEFEGRAEWGASFINGERNDDLNGHGTHVAGTVAGVTYGVAKKTTVVAVKVLGSNGSGTTAGIISGAEWISKNSTPDRDTVNISIGGGVSSALDGAVNSLVNDFGIFVAVSAGNSNTLACNQSPARAANAFATASISQAPEGNPSDIRSSFSNYGTCVNIFAPGEAVTSAWIGSNDAIRTISGTSMASPHVCGVASLIQGQQSLAPIYVANQLIEQANPDTISNPGAGSPNIVLFSGC